MDSVSLLKELIKIDSSSREGANDAIEYCVKYLNENGVNGELIENNGFKSFVASIGAGDKTLILNGHLDVVSGNKEQFNPIEEDGKVIGRGSADMKSGCVAMIQSFIKMKNEQLNNKIMLQLVSDEETGGVNCSRYLVDQGYLGDFVICTEPTNMNISLQSKGIVRVDIVTKGVSAHGSRPWLGVNAISKSYENFEKIKALPILAEGSDFYDESSLNLAFIKGGDIYNRVPDSCTMGLDIRYVPFLDPKEIIKRIEEVVDGEVHLNVIEPGVATKLDDPYVQAFSRSFESITGETCDYAVQHGGSDGRFYAEKGIPVIEFGPTGKYWHGDNEYVEIDSIYQLEKVLESYMQTF